ncbi:MAG: nucleotidyltransferase domain-containing protein [Sulfurovum sp.]
MRLSQKEIEATRVSFLKTFGRGEIYLFGSRVDDTKRGGDIDLYIVLEKDMPFTTIFDKKIDFLVELKQKIGDQKIDVIISKDKNRPIEQEALRNGIKL